MYGILASRPTTVPGSVGRTPPTVFTRWMYVTPSRIPGALLETAVSRNQGIAVGSGVHGIAVGPEPTTRLPLLVSQVGPP